MSGTGDEVSTDTDTQDTVVDTGAEGGKDKAGDTADQPSEAETRARRMGWHPKDEYEASGRDVSKWVDHEEFIRRGEEQLPVIKERYRKLEKQYSGLEGKLEEGHKLLRDLVSRQAEREKAAVEKAIKNLKQERREAARIGDDDKVEEISNEIAEQEAVLKAEPEKKAETKNPNADIPPEVVAEIDTWVKANPWFEEDPVMSAAARSFYANRTNHKTMSETQRLAATRAEIVRRFPEKFTNPNRSKAPAVESGGKQPRSNGKSWDDIPAEDRQLAERLIRNGAVKDKAAYVKEYFSYGSSNAA